MLHLNKRWANEWSRLFSWIYSKYIKKLSHIFVCIPIENVQPLANPFGVSAKLRKTIKEISVLLLTPTFVCLPIQWNYMIWIAVWKWTSRSLFVSNSTLNITSKGFLMLSKCKPYFIANRKVSRMPADTLNWVWVKALKTFWIWPVMANGRLNIFLLCFSSGKSFKHPFKKRNQNGTWRKLRINIGLSVGWLDPALS